MNIPDDGLDPRDVLDAIRGGIADGIMNALTSNGSYPMVSSDLHHTIGEAIGGAIRDVFSSPNTLDANWEPANVVDVIGQLAAAVHREAAAREITNAQREITNAQQREHLELGRKINDRMARHDAYLEGREDEA